MCLWSCRLLYKTVRPSRPTQDNTRCFAHDGAVCFFISDGTRRRVLWRYARLHVESISGTSKKVRAVDMELFPVDLIPARASYKLPNTRTFTNKQYGVFRGLSTSFGRCVLCTCAFRLQQWICEYQASAYYLVISKQRLLCLCNRDGETISWSTP